MPNSSHLEELSAQRPQSRREFLEFIGRTALATSAASLLPWLSACTSIARRDVELAPHGLPFVPLKPSRLDQLELARGLQYSVVLRAGEPLNRSGDRAGANCDYLAFFPLDTSGNDGVLWVNHESMHTLFVSGRMLDDGKTREQVDLEQLAVGGSLVRIRRAHANERWTLVANDPLNRRLTGKTKIPLIAPRPIEGSLIAMGTVANCAGGVTPWGTVLTCEENYDHFYGETRSIRGKSAHADGKFGWEQYFPNPPEHYGWVVEVDPLTGAAKKHTALGRFAHECATVRTIADGRVAVYSGDDAEGRCLYKFISNRAGSLEGGTLYVADLENGRWIPLVRESNKDLRTKFKDHTEMMIRCREAAVIAGGTPLDRPEDIEVDPLTGDVYVTLTMNLSRGNPYGSILKIRETGGNSGALTFTSSTFMAGGAETGFACPDNLAFDRRGNLWMTCDIAGYSIGKAPYEAFGNNSLFYLPLHGEHAGRAFRVANAPIDAEFTGPTFSPDGRTLFLSVQHPGEESRSFDQLTSHWPDGGSSVPQSAVVALSGPTLDALVEGEAPKPMLDAPVFRA